MVSRWPRRRSTGAPRSMPRMPLHGFFEKRSDVYVGSDMFVYYREGDLRCNVVPDVWVAFGVAKAAGAPHLDDLAGGKGA